MVENDTKRSSVRKLEMILIDFFLNFGIRIWDSSIQNFCGVLLRHK